MGLVKHDGYRKFGFYRLKELLRADAGDDEMGPDPNDGEADDGKPLDWRQARTRASARRRPPPRLRD